MKITMVNSGLKVFLFAFGKKNNKQQFWLSNNKKYRQFFFNTGNKKTSTAWFLGNQLLLFGFASLINFGLACQSIWQHQAFLHDVHTARGGGMCGTTGIDLFVIPSHQSFCTWRRDLFLRWVLHCFPVHRLRLFTSQSCTAEINSSNWLLFK